MREKPSGGLERRALGKTGEKLSFIGFGGIVINGVSAEEASRSVRFAIDAGINYFDVAPSYGNAEDMMGPALEPYRKDVFLACKTQERTKDGAAFHLPRAAARALRAEGARVVLSARRADRLEETAKETEGVAVPVLVGDPARIRRTAEELGVDKVSSS